MGGDGTGERTLAAMLRSGPMTVGDAIRVASDVADEVAALHAAGRAHGGVGPDTVAVAPDGSAALVGPPAPRTGLAAAPGLRSDDLHGVGRVLAAALGRPEPVGLPGPVADLVERAETSDAPAAALAAALRRLEREPLALAALLAPVARPVPAGRARLAGLVQLVPRADRRTTGTAAAVVAGAAAIGAMLLLIGSPAGTGRAPAAAAEAARSVPAQPEQAPVVVDAAPDPTAVQAILRPSTKRTRAVPVLPAAPRRTEESTDHVAVPAAEVAVPAARPTPSPTGAPTTSAPDPVPSASSEPTGEPTTPPTAAPEPTADPAPQPSDPEPSAPPPAAPTTAPTAPAPAPTATTPTATTAG